MKHLNSLLSLLFLAALSWSVAGAQTPTVKNAASLDRAQSLLNGGQVSFIQNRGQWDPKARFLARFDGLDLWVTDNSVSYDLYRIDGTLPQKSGDPTAASGEQARRVGQVVRMNFVGTTAPSAQGVGKLPGTFNYFMGSDPSKWVGDVPQYAQARINHLYNGVDAALYLDQGRPRYDILLAPGADPAAIRVNYDGANSLTVGRAGELVIATSLGDLKQEGLYAYQMVDGQRQQVRCAFKLLAGNHVGFAVGEYDRKRPLVIDPLIVGTYLSSSGFTRGFDIATDGERSIYVTGFTGFPTYPTSQGAYQSTFGGNTDAMITKLDSTGKILKYATFIGGNADDVATAMAVDATGVVYLTGYTYSPDFPTQNAYDNSYNGVNKRDVFVLKLDPSQPTPATQLLYSTYVGGSEDDFAMGLAVKSGAAYVTGYTFSANFPTVTPFQAAMGAQGDAFVFRLGNTGNTLVSSTFLGGNNTDFGYDVGVDNTGNVYVTGVTYATNFPTSGSTPAFDATSNGSADAFLTKLSPTLNAIVFSTYIGGSGVDEGRGLAVDANGNAYITGKAALGFPYKSGAADTTYNGGDDDIFVCKFTNTGGLAYSTFIGGNNDEWGNDVAIDAAGDAFVAGVTRAQNFPTTSNALQATLKGIDFDGFVAEVNPTGTALLYSSYLGGSSGDTATAIALDQFGYIYTTGTSFSSNFPTTPNSYQSTGVGGIFIAKLGVMKMTSPNGGEVWCAGDIISITWDGGAEDAAYDLYISADSGRTFAPIAFSVPGRSYDWGIPPSLPPSNQYRIKVLISNGIEGDLSRQLTINAPPAIQSQPVNATAGVGGTATFIATATGTPAPTVRWQVKQAGAWTDIPAQTGSSLKLTNVTPVMNGTLYRAVFTNSCSTVISDSAMLIVPSINVTAPNGGEAFCAGTPLTISWETAETGPANVLYSSDGGANWTSITSNVSGKTFLWNIPATLSGTRFRIQVTVNGQTQDMSNANFTINARPKVTRQPVNSTSSTGSNASFTVDASGLPVPSVMWQVNDGTGWVAVDSAGTSTTLTLVGLTIEQNGRRYRAVFTNDCGSDTTVEAHLTVNVDPSSVEEDAVAARAFNLTLVPNPASSSAKIHYSLPRSGRVQLEIVDMAGRTVARPLDAYMAAGQYDVMFDASAIPAGAYNCVLVFGGKHSTASMRVVR